MDRIKLKTLVPKGKNQEDSFFYDGDIAELTYKDREVRVYATGEIRIQNRAGEVVHDGNKERNSGFRGKFHLNTDKDLKRIGNNRNDEYYWEENNWFELVYKRPGLAMWHSNLGVDFSYDSAIKAAKELIKDDKFWKEVD